MKIGCDLPVIYNLIYSVTLSDGEWTTTDQINIFIHDVNNQPPEFGVFSTDLHFYENITTGELIQSIVATDADRDGKMLGINDYLQLGLYYLNFSFS